MENATKALLIAAAILIAIMIISLGLVVFNMGKETVSNINLNAQEIEAHNNKFTPYEGTSKRGNQVNALLNTVLTNNTTLTEDEAGQKVTVYDGTDSVWLGSTATSLSKRADTGKTYTVTMERDASTGLITSIHITQNAANKNNG